MERKADERQNTDPHELEQLPGEHSDIFQNPHHILLPPRSMDHIIELIPGSVPIRKRSYRQSHKNKSKIERLVQ